MEPKDLRLRERMVNILQLTQHGVQLLLFGSKILKVMSTLKMRMDITIILLWVMV